tara:strand:- start:469 stop:1206 length:738 start_codon:yes stop_codon:yes gene_type:complete
MQLDVVDLLDFYRTPLGQAAASVLTRQLSMMWPDTKQDRVLGLGFPTPFLGPFLPASDRVFAFMPAGQGIFAWPKDGNRSAVLVDETALPLPDSSIDRLLMVHTLEMVNDPLATLQEAWRVLAPGGRIIVVVPSRGGLWARLDVSPFGFGRPFSRGQLQKLLRDALFSPEKWQGALYMPPSNSKVLLRSAAALEKAGQKFWPAFCGVILAEATKRLYQGLPVTSKSKSGRKLRPTLVPASTRQTR